MHFDGHSAQCMHCQRLPDHITARWAARWGCPSQWTPTPPQISQKQVCIALPPLQHPGWSLMRHLACSSGAQFEDLPPSAVEESPGTPARLRSLRPLINSSGLVRYSLLIEDPSLLLHNVAVVQDYAELDWGSKENSARNIAFYCNAYNIWAMYLAFKKMRKHGLAWKGTRCEFDIAKSFVLDTCQVCEL